MIEALAFQEGLRLPQQRPSPDPDPLRRHQGNKHMWSRGSGEDRGVVRRRDDEVGDPSATSSSRARLASTGTWLVVWLPVAAHVEGDEVLVDRQVADADGSVGGVGRHLDQRGRTRTVRQTLQRFFFANLTAMTAGAG